MENLWPRVQKDPFRLLFFIGAIFALTGMAPWALQPPTHAYPRDLHRILMIDGFLLSFVCGFLMTAIPRFTGSYYANKWEIIIVTLMLALTGVGAFTATQELSYVSASGVLLTVMVFAFRRFRSRTANPPSTFIFVGVGLFLWLLSNVGQLAIYAGVINGDHGIYLVLDDLYSNGAIMCLILGVGGRLIPAILGWQEIVPSPRATISSESFLRAVSASIWLAMVAFVLSYFLRPLISFEFCMAVRLAVTVFFAIQFWRISRFPPKQTYLSWSVWICCWCLVAGFIVPIVWPQLGIHGLHVLFVSGFSLLTLLISMRVNFAHSSAGTNAEKTTPAILFITGLILIAMLTRVTAVVWPKLYLEHLMYASVVWIAALVVWIFIIRHCWSTW